MPIIPVSMTSESYNHAKMVTDFAVIVTGTPASSTDIENGVMSLVNALHELVAGATVTNDTLSGTTRTIIIELGKDYEAGKKTDLDIHLGSCLASITAAEVAAPGLVLKV